MSFFLAQCGGKKISQKNALLFLTFRYFSAVLSA
jgi:hypothetical protein